jgi:hypothetical protein
LKGAIFNGSGALKLVTPAGRFEDGHFSSLSERGTHMGKPLKAIELISMIQSSTKPRGRLTCHAGIHVIRCEERMLGIACGEDGIRVVNAYDLATLEGDLAVGVQLRDLAAVKFQRELRDLHDASDCLAVDIVAVNLRRLVHCCAVGSWYTHSDLVACKLTRSHLFHTDPGSWELELQVLRYNDIDTIDLDPATSVVVTIVGGDLEFKSAQYFRH